MGKESDWDVIGPRIRKLAAGKSRAALAEQAGLSKSTIDNILAGKSEPAFSKVVRLAEALGVGLHAVAFGIGPESGDGNSDDDQEFVRVSLFDIQASAGPGAVAPAVEQPTAIKFRADWLSKRGANLNDLQAIRVRGDSMEPTLKNGDLIVIDTIRTTPSDGIYVIAHDDEIQVKRLQRLSPTKLVIASDNPLAGNTEIDLRDETQHPRIIGRVIWLGRDL